jgi:hypothetical protein
MNPSIEIDDLTVSQDAMRHTAQIAAMIEYIRTGGFWTCDALEKFATDNDLKVCPLIEIVQFPDGRYMIHDGHHRVVSTYLGGRHFLRGDEYRLKHWTYENYGGINFVNKWVTPFNPKSEIRLPDFWVFKKKVFELLEIDKDAATRYILDNGPLYKRLRTISGVACLADRYNASHIDEEKDDGNLVVAGST